jgi:septum formation protein
VPGRRRQGARRLAQVLADDPQARVLGSDTEVVLDGEVFGKPADAAGARAMLARLAGRTHQVMTAVVVVGADGLDSELVISEVTFAPIAAADIAAYVATGEPLDKAGAYAIQGGAERWIEHLSGSYSGVMGLPLLHTDRLLARCGVPAPTADAAREAADV